MIQNKIPSNKSFGIVFFILFLIISLWPLLNSGNVRIWSLLLSIIFLILGILNSRILTPFNKIWMKFGVLLSNVVSPIIMVIVFFLVITPIGLLMRLFKKDLLNLKFNKNYSYWIEKKGPLSKMKNQF
tara:strand:- start:2926 stop:3309 length:384 start_codon:yes stop_codon:yes gene_type:complete